MTTLAPATTSVATTPEVVGKALYLELAPILDSEGNPVAYYGGKGSVKQLVIMPSGTTPEGHKVHASIWDRIVSPSYPRSQWSNKTLNPMPSKAEFSTNGKPNYRGLELEAQPTISEAESMPDEIVKSLMTNSAEHALYSEMLQEKSTYDRENEKYNITATPAWEIVRQFAVEVTDKDLADVRSWKTPQAVVRRINKVRVSLGLPEKLV